VIDMGKVEVLNASALEAAQIPSRTRRILFKTRNSAFWARQLSEFQKDFAAIDASGAEWLVRRGVQLVGVDYLSVAPYKKGLDTHKILLGAGIVVVEGLNLTGVSQGRYALYCLPLKLVGSDGAPARAILVGV
jgi:arylformamidase